MPAEPLEVKSSADISERLSRSLNVDRIDAAKGVAAMLPILMRGMRCAVDADPRGARGFLNMLHRICEPHLLAKDPIDGDIAIRRGQMLLAEILGPKVVCQIVAADAARTSGLNSELVREMLPATALLIAQDIANRLK